MLRAQGKDPHSYIPRRKGSILSDAVLVRYEETVQQVEGYESLTAFLQQHSLRESARILGRSPRTIGRLKQMLRISKKRHIK